MTSETTGDVAAAAPSLDPTTFAVIYNAFHAVVEEMSLTFERSAWSSIIAEARDFSCAIYDASDPPNALCVFDGLPMHVNGQPVALAEVARFFGSNDLYEGDIILVNSAYWGNTHIGDFVVATPVFHDGDHVFWAAATGHVMDVGSAYNTSVPIQAADTFAEGLQISPLKLYERGVLRKDVLELVLGNVRYRDFVYGDLMSQIGSVKTCNRRLLELLDKWGAKQLEVFNQQLIEYADRRTANIIAKWPDGQYEGVTWVDSDGAGRRDIVVRCTLTVAGTDVEIDFDGSAPQTLRGVNSSWAGCQSAATTPILCCLDSDLPHNQGCLRHIRVTAPTGTIVNAEQPAATASATTTPADAISDAVWKCLAQIIPEQVAAGNARVAPNCVTAGKDRRIEGIEKPFGMILFNGSGGGGATASNDGWPFMVTPGTVGGLKFAPIEIIELHYPLLVLEYQIRTDSMGAGRYIGGPGLSFRVTPVGTRVDNYGYGDGMMNPPYGLYGGCPGDGGALYRENPDGSRTVFGPLAYFRVEEGDVWCAVSSGGGGYGDPLDRPSEQVRIDVEDGLVSQGSAHANFGVVLSNGSLEVDEIATAALRDEKRQGRQTTAIVPTGPGAGTYSRSLLRGADVFEFDADPPGDAAATL